MHYIHFLPFFIIFLPNFIANLHKIFTKKMKSFIAIFFVFVSTTLFAQQTTNTNTFITLTGKFADMVDSAEVSFLHPSSQAPIATAVAKNKTFKLFAPVNFAGLSRLTINNKTGVYNYDLFIGAETATITGTLANIEKAVVKGAKHQIDFKTIIKKFEPNFKKLNTINQSIQQETDPTKRMESKKGINWFFALIAFTIGLTLFKHIDFKNLSLKDPVLDILYLIVFIISIYLIIKDYKKRPVN